MTRVDYSKRGQRKKQGIRILKKRRGISRAYDTGRRRVSASPNILKLMQKAKKREVTTVRYYQNSKSGYTVCPACGYGMEREYQNYCEVCGQHLAWNRFRRNDVTVQRFIGKPSAKQVFHTRKKESEGSNPITGSFSTQ